MKLPKSPCEHITERESWKILHSCLPSEWILRDVTGRDYGIDCYIELVNKKNEITGDLVSIQLKGKRNIKWKQRSGHTHKTSLFSGIRIETVNYWMRLPVPTFLCVADLSTKKLYFAPIETQVRNRYEKLVKNKTFSFNLDERLELTKNYGILLLLVNYSREKFHPSFSYYLTNLLNNAELYMDFLGENLYRDPFLEVEMDRVVVFVNMYRTFGAVANYLGIEWKVTPLSDAFKKDRETWKEHWCLLHEQTLGDLLKEMLPLMPIIFNKGRELVTKKQKHYWKNKDFLLYQFCLMPDIDNIVKELTEVDARVREFESRKNRL